MIKKIPYVVYVFTLSLFLCFIGTTNVQAQKKNNSKEDVKPPQRFLSFDAGKNYSLQNSSQLLETEFKFSPQTSFISVNEEQDKLGYTHKKFQQYYNGVKVEFATFVLHAEQGKVISMSNNLFYINELETNPAISTNMAFNSAKNHVGATTYLWENTAESALADNYKKPEGELVIFPAIKNISESSRLAFKFDIYASDPVYRADVYIDAHTGAFIMENKIIHHANVPATGTSLYNGNVSFTADSFNGSYRLRQTASGNGIQTYDLNGSTNYSNAQDVTSGSTNFTGNATGVQAHYGAEQTHEYFLIKHGRNSYNGSGALIRSYVSYSNNYVNAFWDGSRMTYGDGDGVNYGPLVSLDIVGHELGHGVTEYSANLIYSYESGALNESFSDIFGENIENYATGSNDWLMGDQIGAGGSGGALRNMSNPNQYGDPDTYLGSNWNGGSSDNGGVHTNSGVQNFWFYLLSVGGNGTNDNGNPYTVAAIGMEKAAAIAYRNLTQYLNSNSQYSDARTGAIQAAVDLYGAESDEEIAVTNAWFAVGVGDPYGGPLPPAPCFNSDVYLTITLDNYPEETAWTLTNSGGTVIASESYSTSNPDGSTVTATFSALADDAYTFTITDSYGDGICCSYGTGSYTLSNDDGIIFSGGSFGSSQDVDFCISTEVANTCDDGIQNGDETGVDCGGTECAPCNTTAVILHEGYFETGMDGWVLIGDDAVRYIGPRSYEGDYSIRLRDNSNTSTMTLKNVRLDEPYSSIEVDFYFKAIGMDAGETFQVEYYDGSTWNTVAIFAEGTDYDNKVFYHASVTISSSEYNFPLKPRFKFRGNGSNTNDHVYIDQVIISANQTTVGSGQVVRSLGTPEGFVNQDDDQDIFTIFPNPTKSILNVRLLNPSEINSYKIVNMLGQVILQGKLDGETTVEVGQIQSGVYFIEVNDGDQTMIKRFIKE